MEIVMHARGDWPGDAPVEIVERKGAGHPDTLCDAIAERVCMALCRHDRDRFGAILHHNVDKVLLVGGAARPRFGGGEVIAPIEIYLAGRATAEWRGVPIPCDELAIAACREVLAERLPLLRLDRDVRIVSRIRPGSAALATLFAGSGVPRANDSSIGVGFAPLTRLERGVLAVERALVAPATRREHLELGSDVKVLAMRRGEHVDLALACALIDRHVASLDAYVAYVAAARRLARDAFGHACDIELNAADDVARGSIYLTVTGSSAEAGDDGEVGRGNRTSGLITPGRPMTIEAAAGKNPVSHVGKLYSVVAGRIASAVVAELPELCDASCLVVSRIGAPIDRPAIVELATRRAPAPAECHAIEEIVHAQLGSYAKLRDELVAGAVPLF